MTRQEPRRTEHQVKVAAPADTVYGLVAGVDDWPRVFPPTVFVERLETDGRNERLQIWATANGDVKTWTSRRHLDPAARRIEFRQEVSQHPVASMGGAWMIAELGPDESLVTLEHDYTAVGEGAEHADNTEWIERAIDRNSHAELAALAATAEAADALGERLLTFDDTLTINGKAADVYEFIYDAGAWRGRLPHVARVELTEDTPNLQVLEMDTRTKDGSTHTTRSVRVCFPHKAIVYKQLLVPALLTAHTGRWLIEETAPGTVTLTSRHTIVVKPEAVTGVLGPAATVATAREFVHKALSGNSTATMRLARDYAEARR